MAVSTIPKSTRKRLWGRLAVAVFLVVFGWGVSWLAARMLLVKAPLEHADVIVVLSGSSAFGERTHVAAKLYSEGVAEKILLTNDNLKGGWLSSEQRNPFFYERARWELQRLGVPESKIEVLPIVKSTHEEALAVRDYVESKKIRSLVIVTSAYHSRRALWTFQRVLGGRVRVGLVSPPAGWQTPEASHWWLSTGGWRTVPAEYLKMVYYWFRF